MPKKTFDAEPEPRREIQRQETPHKKTRVYKHLDEFKRAIARTKLSSWSRKETEHHCTLEYFDSQHATPLYTIRVDSGLGFSVAVFGWFLPDNHELYYEHKRSLFHISASSLCKVVQFLSLCPGLPGIPHDAVNPVVGTSRVTKHTVPVAPELLFRVVQFGRSGIVFQLF